MLEPFDDPDLANQYHVDSVFIYIETKTDSSDIWRRLQLWMYQPMKRVSDLNWFDINGPFLILWLKYVLFFFVSSQMNQTEST
jgi:hypothetical protein